ncbi:trigger factor [Chitinispirillales bacterium ANBcel5]|uniref:trigger factor n=1 Tax=Cellulosispirillum alkaliphilum TaxID=3039283 RepID=UPI002A54020A|nr:trigger factor [Chitinispirillales bacterium ANBcel5]
MKATVSEPASWKRTIEIEIPEQQVQEAFDQKLNKYRREIKLPGFRQGKVPANLVKQRFGAEIRAEVVDELVQKSYKDACSENEIVPVSPASVSDVEDKEGKPLKLTIETQVDPPIEIKGYDKLKVKVKTPKIKDSDIDQAVEDLKNRFAEFEDVDRPAKKGDHIRFEYRKVLIDGEEQEGVKNPEYPVELGGKSQLKDFDKALTGHSAGDVVDVTVNFPEDYEEKAAAGKKGEFTIEIKAVQEKKVPEIDEKFLKSLGDFENEAALRERIKQDMESQAKEQARNKAIDEAIGTLIKENPFEVPPARIDAFVNYMYEESQRYRRGDEPMPSKEQIAEQYHETAINSIKRQRIIDFIADKEKVKATQEEVDQEIKRLATMYNQDFDTLKQTLRKNGTTNRIRADLREKKTLDFLIGESEEEKESK